MVRVLLVAARAMPRLEDDADAPVALPMAQSKSPAAHDAVVIGGRVSRSPRAERGTYHARRRRRGHRKDNNLCFTNFNLHNLRVFSVLAKTILFDGI